MKPICVCRKTSRNAKASHFGRGVCGADGEGKDAAKEPDTQRYAPCLSEPSYRNAAGVISPGLPSQALTRQLPQSGSPWQRGVVLLRLIKVRWKAYRTANASHFGRGVCGADGEGKDAAKEPDTQRYAPCLSEPSYRNAAGVISPGLPSQALTRQLPQSGSPWQRGVVLLRLIKVRWKAYRTANASHFGRGVIKRSDDDGEVLHQRGGLRCTRHC